MYPKGLTVIDRLNLKEILESSDTNAQVKQSISGLASGMRGVMIKDVHQENSPSVVINELAKPYLLQNDVNSLREFLEKQEKVMKEKKLQVTKNSIVIGPNQIQATEYVRHDEQVGIIMDVYNIFFEKEGRIFNISFMSDTNEKFSTSDAYETLKRTLLAQ